MATANRRALGPPALLGYRAAAAMARALPESMLGAVENGAATLGTLVAPSRRAQVERNLDRVYGTTLVPAVRKRAVHETFATYVRYWLESFRLPGTPSDVLDARVVHTGFEHIEQSVAAGGGTILALPHLGGWEWAAYWLTSVHGMQVSAVVEPVQPPELAEWFVSLRESFGLELIPLGPSAASSCAKALNDNRVLCLLSDRDLSGGGVAVDFFGEATTVPGGPATLSLRTGAPLITCATYYEGRSRHRFVIDPPVDTTRRDGLRADVGRVTQEVTDRLEVLISAAPEQWHLLQPNWPSDRG